MKRKKNKSWNIERRVSDRHRSFVNHRFPTFPRTFCRVDTPTVEDAPGQCPSRRSVLVTRSAPRPRPARSSLRLQEEEEEGEGGEKSPSSQKAPVSKNDAGPLGVSQFAFPPSERPEHSPPQRGMQIVELASRCAGWNGSRNPGVGSDRGFLATVVVSWNFALFWGYRLYFVRLKKYHV